MLNYSNLKVYFSEENSISSFKKINFLLIKFNSKQLNGLEAKTV